MSATITDLSADWRTEHEEAAAEPAGNLPVCWHNDCHRTHGVEPVEILGGYEPVTKWACLEHLEAELGVKFFG